MRWLGRRFGRPMVALMILGLVAAACTGDDSGDTMLSQGGGEADSSRTGLTGLDEIEAPASGDPYDGGDGGEVDEAAALGNGGIEPIVLQVANFGRDIIFTADLTVAVPHVAEAGKEATRIIGELGGFLFGQHTEGSPDGLSILTFKVSPDKFDEALARLGSIGEVRTQNVSASDVTERIVDLESQIKTATASVERLRALLAEAGDIKTIVDLESELLARETLLEGLRAQLRTLQEQVALATIVVTLTEAASNPELALTVTGYAGHDSGALCPGAEDLVFDKGDNATLCFSLVNTGDTSLASFELRDPVLDLEIGDLIPVLGDPDAVLEPGESMVLAAEIDVERSLRTQTSVSAEPVDPEGDPLSGPMAIMTTVSHLDAVDPGGIPTFSEGLEASWQWLISLGEAVLLVIAALIPFAWVPALVWIGARLWSRRTKPAVPGGEEV